MMDGSHIIPESLKVKLEKTQTGWIVWEIDRITRQVDLRAICTTEANAKASKYQVDWHNKEWEKDKVCYIEKTRFNHLFGESTYGELFNK